MNNAANAKKKDFFYIVVLILTFVAVIIGATIAAYYFLHKFDEGSSAVYTGTLEIQYLSGDIINFEGLYPALEPDYNDDVNIYKNNFKVSNTGSLDSIISIYVDVNRNEFSDDVIQYKIFNSTGEELEMGDLSGDGKKEIVSNTVLEHEKTVEYTLMLWIKETGENQNEEMRKNLTGTIKVEANQKID